MPPCPGIERFAPFEVEVPEAQQYDALVFHVYFTKASPDPPVSEAETVIVGLVLYHPLDELFAETVGGVVSGQALVVMVAGDPHGLHPVVLFGPSHA